MSDGEEYDSSHRNNSRFRRSRSFSRSRSRSPRRRSPHDQEPIQTEKVYVSNMPYDTKWHELKDLFKEHVGEVVYVKLYDGPDGGPSGAGVVQFASIDLAQKAIDNMHKYDMKGRKIIVREEKERDRMRHSLARQYYRRFGASGGEAMAEDEARLRGSEGGSRAGPRGRGPPPPPSRMAPDLPPDDDGVVTNQVFIANLDYKVTPGKLREVFKMAGNISHVEMKMDQAGKSRGMAVVKYEHPMEALQAISMFDNQQLFDRTMTVKMDKFTDTQHVPNRLPAGLRSIGSGLGADGQPVNVARFESTLGGALSGGLPSSIGGLGRSGGSADPRPSLGDLGGLGAASLGGLQNSLLELERLERMERERLERERYDRVPAASTSRFGPAPRYGGGSGPIGRGGPPRTGGGRPPMGGRVNDGQVAVFVRNLPFHYTWQDLKTKFRAAGDVQYTKIREENGRSTGSAVVAFGNIDDARTAVEMFDSSRIEGRPIEVKLDRRV